MTRSSPTRAKKRAERKARSPAVTLITGPPELLTTTTGPRAELPIEKLGYPGVLGELHVAPVWDGQQADADAVFRDSEARVFEVATLLSKSPTNDQAVDLAFGVDDGNSYFVIATPMAVMTPWGEVTIDKNAHGEAAMISMQCEARSSQEALTRLRLAVSTFLDHWSFTATAPAYLSRLRAVDTKHGVQTIQFNCPFTRSSITPSRTEIPTRLRPMMALYREALCATSPIYRFLCLYKILEGYFGRLKPELAQLFEQGGVAYRWPKESVPDHKDYAPDLRRYAGGPIVQFKDQQLSPNFRDAVAHFALDGEQPLIASDPEEIQKFNHVGIAVELCARVVLQTYQQAFSAAQDAGLDLSSFVETARGAASGS